MNHYGLGGRVAVITGAASGIDQGHEGRWARGLHRQHGLGPRRGRVRTGTYYPIDGGNLAR